MNCPVCGYGIDGGTQCSSCGTDITGYIKVAELPSVYYNEAVSLLSEGHLKKSQQAFEAVVSLDPNDAEALRLLGQVSADLGDYDRAIDVWEQVITLDEGAKNELRPAIERARGANVGLAAQRQVSEREEPKDTETLAALDELKAQIRMAWLKAGAIGALAVVLGMIAAFIGHKVLVSSEISELRQEMVARTAVFPKALEATTSKLLEPVRQEMETIHDLAVRTETKLALREDLRTRVKSALGSEAGLEIGVGNGETVFITGLVNTLWDKSRVGSIAAKVPGVKAVDVTNVDLRYPQGHFYVVRTKDSLWSLAERFLGDGNRHDEVFEANRGILSNPSVIAAGTRILIPE